MLKYTFSGGYAKIPSLAYTGFLFRRSPKPILNIPQVAITLDYRYPGQGTQPVYGNYLGML